MRIEFQIEEWYNWLRSKRLSDRSMQEYLIYITKIEPIQLTEEFFIQSLNRFNNGVCRAALINLLSYIKTSSRYSPEVKAQAKAIELPKVTGRKRKRIPQSFTEAEIYAITRDLKHEKYKLMLLVTFYAGLRCSELVGCYAIKPYSFNWGEWHKNPTHEGNLRVIGKGNKERIVFIPQKLMVRIMNWIKHEVAQRQSKDDKLFNIGPERWRKVLGPAAKHATGKHMHPHLIRHSTNQWLKGLGWDVRDRQIYMGHENIITTAEYDDGDSMQLKGKFSKSITDSKKHLAFPENNQ